MTMLELKRIFEVFGHDFVLSADNLDAGAMEIKTFTEFFNLFRALAKNRLMLRYQLEKEDCVVSLIIDGKKVVFAFGLKNDMLQKKFDKDWWKNSESVIFSFIPESKQVYLNGQLTKEIRFTFLTTGGGKHDN